MLQCIGKGAPCCALVKGLAREMDIDEPFLERLAYDVRRDLAQKRD
jgi:hypothetical protein